MRLIDADALMDEAIERHCQDCDKRKGIKNGKWRIVYNIGDAPCRACDVDDMKDDIDNAPTIDAVPVVRCKDCKHRKTCLCPLHEAEFNEWECDFEYYDHTEDEGYCHRGERKDDDN